MPLNVKPEALLHSVLMREKQLTAPVLRNEFHGTEIFCDAESGRPDRVFRNAKRSFCDREGAMRIARQRRKRKDQGEKRKTRSHIVREAYRPGGSRYYLLPARSTFPLSSLQRE